MKALKTFLGISLFILSFNSNALDITTSEAEILACAAYADITARDSRVYPALSGKRSPLTSQDYSNFIATSRMHLIGLSQNHPLSAIVSSFKTTMQIITSESGKKTGYKLNGRTFNLNYLQDYMDYNMDEFVKYCSPITGLMQKTAAAYDSEEGLTQASLELKEEFRKQGVKW